MKLWIERSGRTVTSKDELIKLQYEYMQKLQNWGVQQQQNYMAWISQSGHQGNNQQQQQYPQWGKPPVSQHHGMPPHGNMMHPGNQMLDNQQQDPQEMQHKIPSLLDQQHQGTPPNMMPGNHGNMRHPMRPMMRPGMRGPRPNFAPGHPNMRARGPRPPMMGGHDDQYFHDDGQRPRGPRPNMRGGFGPRGPRGMMNRPGGHMVMNRHPVAKQGMPPHNDQEFQGNFNDQGMPRNDQKMSRFDQMPPQYNEQDHHNNRPPFQPRNPQQQGPPRHPQQQQGGFRTPQQNIRPQQQRFDQPPQQQANLLGNQQQIDGNQQQQQFQQGPGFNHHGNNTPDFYKNNNMPPQHQPIPSQHSNMNQINQPIALQNQQQIQPMTSQQNNFQPQNNNLKIISPNDNQQPPGTSPSPLVVNSDQPPPPGDDNVQLPINVISSTGQGGVSHQQQQVVEEQQIVQEEITEEVVTKTPKKKKKKKHRKRKHSSSSDPEDVMEKIRQIEKMVKKKEDIEDGEVKSGSDGDPALDSLLDSLRSKIKPKKKKKKHKKDKKRSKKARKDYKSSSSDSDNERRTSLSRNDQYHGHRSHRDGYGHDKRDTDARYDAGKYSMTSHDNRRSRDDHRGEHPNIDEADDMQLLAMNKKFNKRSRSKDFSHHGDHRPGLLSTPPDGYRNKRFEDEPIPTNKKRKVVVKENKKINDWNRHKDDNDLVHFYSDEEAPEEEALLIIRSRGRNGEDQADREDGEEERGH